MYFAVFTIRSSTFDIIPHLQSNQILAHIFVIILLKLCGSELEHMDENKYTIIICAIRRQICI